MWRGTLEADFIVAHRYFLLAKTLNKSDVAPRNRVIDPRGLESPSPIFKTLILSLVSFSQTVCQPVLIPTCYAGHSTDSLERPWGCERMRTGGEGDDKGWDGWMSSLTQWTWIWENSGKQWRTGKPGVLKSMGLQQVGHDLGTEQEEVVRVLKQGLFGIWKSWIVTKTDLESMRLQLIMTKSHYSDWTATTVI